MSQDKTVTRTLSSRVSDVRDDARLCVGYPPELAGIIAVTAAAYAAW